MANLGRYHRREDLSMAEARNLGGPGLARGVSLTKLMSRPADVPSQRVLISIPGRLLYLPVVSIVAFLTYGAGAAPADHAPDAAAPPAQATLARKSVVEHAS
jgi:hypothetical protein